MFIGCLFGFEVGFLFDAFRIYIGCGLDVYWMFSLVVVGRLLDV